MTHQSLTDPRIAFIDCETTGLDPLTALPSPRAWEWAVILRTPGSLPDYEYHAFVDLRDLAVVDLAQDGPNAKSLEIGGFYERHPQASGPVEMFAHGALVTDVIDWRAVKREAEIAADLYRMTFSAILAGMQVGQFDAAFAEDMLKRCEVGTAGQAPWHYRVIDLGSYAAGALGLPANPGTDSLLEAYGIEYPPSARHTALGDVRVERDLYDAARAYVLDNDRGASA